MTLASDGVVAKTGGSLAGVYGIDLKELEHKGVIV